MRLNKFIAQSGCTSRRDADRLVQAAAVTVNGQVITDPAYQVNPGDVVTVDDQRLSLPGRLIVIMLNKPKGIITTARDTHGRRTVMDLIPMRQRLFPVGRLDKDTTGLILLTNDGNLANQLLHPRYRIQRIYEAVIDRRLGEQSIKRLGKGIFIGNDEFGKAEVIKQHTVKKRTTVTLRLQRGKKREIRRLFLALKIKLFALRRIQFGNLELGDIPVGNWRELTSEEIAYLRNETN